MGKATKLRTAKSWIMLGFLILISFLVILLSREQRELFTGHIAVQPISYMKAGSQDFFEIKGIPGVFGVKVTFAQDTKSNQLRVEEKEIPFDGKFYSKFTVSWKDPAAIESMEFTLKVLEEEVYRKGFNPADLRLYVNGKELPTIQTRKEGRYLYYKATSTEAGEYVIGRASAAKVTQPTTVVPSPEPGILPAASSEPLAEQKAEPLAEPGKEEKQSSSLLVPEPTPAVGQAIKESPEPAPESIVQRLWRAVKSVFRKK